MDTSHRDHGAVAVTPRCPGFRALRRALGPGQRNDVTERNRMAPEASHEFCREVATFVTTCARQKRGSVSGERFLFCSHFPCLFFQLIGERRRGALLRVGGHIHLSADGQEVRAVTFAAARWSRLARARRAVLGSCSCAMKVVLVPRLSSGRVSPGDVRKLRIPSCWRRLRSVVPAR